MEEGEEGEERSGRKRGRRSSDTEMRVSESLSPLSCLSSEYFRTPPLYILRIVN